MLSVTWIPHPVWIACLILCHGCFTNALKPSQFFSKSCRWNPAKLVQHPARETCTVLIDDEGGRQLRWKPWATQPFCVNATNNRATKFCTYTTKLYGDNGISIITKPEIAANVAAHLDDPYVPPNKGKESYGTLGPPYKVAKVRGKGMGLIATRAIPKYDTFMTDYASIVADTDFPVSVKRAQGYELLDRAADGLIDPNQVFQLSRPGKGEANAVESVLRINAFNIDLAGVSHMALFPHISVC
jgi:hypothetical protein